jgi:hypothetical protein
MWSFESGVKDESFVARCVLLVSTSRFLLLFRIRKIDPVVEKHIFLFKFVVRVKYFLLVK